MSDIESNINWSVHKHFIFVFCPWVPNAIVAEAPNEPSAIMNSTYAYVHPQTNKDMYWIVEELSSIVPAPLAHVAKPVSMHMRSAAAWPYGACMGMLSANLPLYWSLFNQKPLWFTMTDHPHYCIQATDAVGARTEGCYPRL